MTRVVLRASALADLETIARYFDAMNRDVTMRVVADVERAIEWLRNFPLSGEAIPGTGLRRITSKRYRFAISHLACTAIRGRHLTSFRDVPFTGYTLCDPN